MPDSLVVANELSELSRVGVWVNAWAERHGIPARTAQRMDQCSAEAVTNIVMYAHEEPGPHRIALRLVRRGEALALEIEDDGKEFDPRGAPEHRPAASLEEANIGGLGIHFLRHFADEIAYRRSGGRNHLTLLFRMTTA